MTRRHQRRLVAVLGTIEALQPHLQLEALRQGITTATQVVWLSAGARRCWRFFEQSFAAVAVGRLLACYHAAQHLWQAAEADGQTVKGRTPQPWF